MYNKCTSPSSARSARGHRMRSPICCLGAANAVVDPEAINGQRTPKSPYEWLKSTALELEIRDRCRRVKTRIKVTCRNNNCVHHHHQRHHSQGSPGDFSYDALSYALNFEDDVRADEDGSYPDFTARLPASPVAKSRSATVDLISF
ncbi:unnamed protein product [Brassica rapa]|uniref:Uncharacterized protein n=1 Tax=Brassica campestris TaxID=3711 RepID=A0A3P6ABZ4_BRACM|nr:unnamed protein product [Brassica rapa]VDC84984.1 unnamed protein product [Brassica rapa]